MPRLNGRPWPLTQGRGRVLNRHAPATRPEALAAWIKAVQAQPAPP